MSLTVTWRPFYSLVVSLAVSSPIFLGKRPSEPIFGARELTAPTSPPVTRTKTSTTWVVSNLVLERNPTHTNPPISWFGNPSSTIGVQPPKTISYIILTLIIWVLKPYYQLSTTKTRTNTFASNLREVDMRSSHCENGNQSKSLFLSHYSLGSFSLHSSSELIFSFV